MPLQIHDALKDVMGDIHALSIKVAWTPKQQQEKLAFTGGA